MHRAPAARAGSRETGLEKRFLCPSILGGDGETEVCGFAEESPAFLPPVPGCRRHEKPPHRSSPFTCITLPLVTALRGLAESGERGPEGACRVPVPAPCGYSLFLAL